METTVDKLGRVTLPKRVRDDLGISEGTVLIIEEQGNRIVLQPIEVHDPTALRGGVLVFTGKLDGDIEAVMQQDREERLAKLMGRDSE